MDETSRNLHLHKSCIRETRSAPASSLMFFKAGAEHAGATGDGCYFVKPVDHALQMNRRVILAVAIKASHLLAPGEAAWPRAELPSWWQLRCGSPELGCLELLLPNAAFLFFSFSFFFFPPPSKWMVFHLLSVSSVSSVELLSLNPAVLLNAAVVMPFLHVCLFKWKTNI